MGYEALFSISPLLLSLVEEIAALRERIFISPVSLSWVPALQKDSRTRNGHASTAIEGNTLTLEEVSALEEGRAVEPSEPRFQREVTNYFAGLRYVEKHVSVKKVRHEHLFELHRLMAGEVMDQGEAGSYRTIGVRVGNHLPPHPDQVSPQMFELLEWWNTKATTLSPILSSAILHYRFEDIHPFADGNGRVGRALALWELYRRGFDSHHVFSVDEYYWEDRPAYYAALEQVRREGGDLSRWLEYSAAGMKHTLERVWLRVQRLQSANPEKITLTPRQENLMGLLRDQGNLAPAEIWAQLKISKQGATKLMKPLLDGGMIEKRGSAKMGRYFLTGK
jgi:Fic family protein